MTEEPLGSVAEEAAKLFAAAQGWLGGWAERTSARTQAGGPGEVGEPVDGEESSTDEHRHAGQAPECAWCPVCRLLRAVRDTGPEVAEIFAQAAVSLAEALETVLAQRSARPAASAEPGADDTPSDARGRCGPDETAEDDGLPDDDTSDPTKGETR